jgi:hypothetical protein
MVEDGLKRGRFRDFTFANVVRRLPPEPSLFAGSRVAARLKQCCARPLPSEQPQNNRANAIRSCVAFTAQVQSGAGGP